jgi:hypothetical protein
LTILSLIIEGFVFIQINVILNHDIKL